MAGCGCSGQCRCRVIAGDGATVSGNGSLLTAYAVNVDISGGDGCLRFMRDCVPRVTGNGLGWCPPVPDDPAQPGTVCLEVSGQPGNLVQVRPDGLYVPAAEAATRSCQRDVTAFPVGHVWGHDGAGPISAPWGTIRSARNAVSQNLEGMTLSVAVLADGALVVAPYGSMLNNWTYPSCVMSPGTQTGGAATNDCNNVLDYLPWARQTPDKSLPPTPIEYDRLTLSAWKTMIVNSEVYSFPQHSNQWGGNTVGEVLDEMGGKIGIAFYLFRNGYTPGNNDVAVQRAIPILRRMIERRCLQKSVIILTNLYSLLTPLNGSGLQYGVFLSGSGDYTANTPAQVAGTGAKWAFLNWNDQPALYDPLAYSGAGLTTVATNATRMPVKAAAIAAGKGFKGVLSENGVYTKGALKPMRKDPWPFGGHPDGQFHGDMDIGGYRTNRRGYNWAAPVANNGNPGVWVMPNLGQGAVGVGETRRDILLAWATPGPVSAIGTNRLVYQWDQMWAPSEPMPDMNDCTTDPVPAFPGASATLGLGLVILQPTDQPGIDRPTPAPVLNYDPPDYYFGYQKRDGSLAIDGKANGAAFTGVVSTPTGTLVAPTAGTWQRFRLIVRSANVELQRLNTGTGAVEQSVVMTHTASEQTRLRTTPDLKYASLRKVKVATEANFPGLYRSLTITSSTTL